MNKAVEIPDLFGNQTQSQPAIEFKRSFKATRYRLTLKRDGTVLATIPARGSEREAKQFVESQKGWLERARQRQLKKPRSEEIWTIGTFVLWRGEMTQIRLAVEEPPAVCLAADVFRVYKLDGNLKPTLEASFARKARLELPGKMWELAVLTGDRKSVV